MNNRKCRSKNCTNTFTPIGKWNRSCPECTAKRKDRLNAATQASEKLNMGIHGYRRYGKTMAAYLGAKY